MEVARGSVADRPFARTIYSLGANRFTGDLILTQSRREYRSSWENGFVVAAVSASPADSPGRVALAQGLVNSSALGRFVQRQAAEPDRDPVDLLVELANLSPAKRLQLRQGVLARAASRIFALPTAEFVVDNARTMRADPEIPAIDLRWLIYLGLRTHYSLQRLKSELSAVGSRGLRLTADSLQMIPAFGFTDLEEPLLQNLQAQELSLENLVQACPEIDEATTTCVVYALMACNYLSVGQSQASAPRAAPEPAPRAAPAPQDPETSISRSKTPTTNPIKIGRPDGADAETVRGIGFVGGGVATQKRPSKVAEETEQLIVQRLKVIDGGGDHYQLLDVPQTASGAVIRKGYFSLARQLHPDRLQAVGASGNADDVQRLFAAINKAFAVLSNAKQRAHYKKVLAAGGEKAYAAEQQRAEAMAIKIFRAEEHFHIGEMALRRNQFEKAGIEFKKATELSPDESEYLSLYAWCFYCNAKDRSAIEVEAMKMMSDALTKNEKSVTTRFYHAKLLKLMGYNDQAIRSFRALLKLDANHREGKLELRLLLE